RILREQGVRFVQEVWQAGAAQPPHRAADDDTVDEEAVSAREMLEEESGLRGRLASFIGRDLGDQEDDVPDRPEPPLRSAPVPRIDPADRAAYVPDPGEPDEPDGAAGDGQQAEAAEAGA